MKAVLFPFCIGIIFFLMLKCVCAKDEVFDSLVTEDFIVHIQVRHDRVVSPSVNETDVILKQFFKELDNELPRLFDLSPARDKAVIFIYSDRETFDRNLVNRGISLLSMPTDRAGGFFDIRTGEILLFQQPTAYYTRQILFHELVHWYIWQLLGDKSLMLPHWFQEGIAEHYAVHQWDGKTLKPATLPLVMLEDYPARALEVVQEISAGQSLERSLDLYALYWGMTRYLILNQPEQFQAMIRHGFPDNPVDWKMLETWLEKEQIPWLWVWNSWEQVGKEIFGVSTTTGMIIYKTPLNQISLSVRPETESWTMGIVFDFLDTDRFEIIQLKKDEKTSFLSWRHISRTSSGWSIQTEWENTNVTALIPGNLEAKIMDQMISLFWNDEVVTTHPLKSPSLLGLSVHESAITFQVHPESAP